MLARLSPALRQLVPKPRLAVCPSVKVIIIDGEMIWFAYVSLWHGEVPQWSWMTAVHFVWNVQICQVPVSLPVEFWHWWACHPPSQLCSLGSVLHIWHVAVARLSDTSILSLYCQDNCSHWCLSARYSLWMSDFIILQQWFGECSVHSQCTWLNIQWLMASYAHLFIHCYSNQWPADRYLFACCIYGYSISVCEIEILAPRNVENGILQAFLWAVVAEI